MASARHLARFAIVSLGMWIAPPDDALAQAKNMPEEYSRILRAAEQVEPLTDSMFGESVSPYNGATEFSITDLDLPGNSRIPVRLQRRYVVEDRQTPGYLGGMGEWDVDVPYMRGTFGATAGWIVSGSSPTARCSQAGAPPSIGGVTPDQFFHGISLHVPGSGDQTVLRRSASTPTGPTGGSASTMVTKSNWHITCLTTAKNGYGGEAFLGRSPDGLKYYFDYPISKAAGDVRASGFWAGGIYYGGGGGATRSTVYFVASRVEDQYGNWVNYNYTGSNLTSITSSDGRTITIHYVSGRADYASAHGTTVYYTYTSGKLTAVRRPDATYWRYSNPGFPGNYYIKADYEVKPSNNFNGCLFELADAPGPQTFSVTHPSGANAVYTFGVQRHARTHVVRECMMATGTPGWFKYPPWAHSYSILSRAVSGPGMATETRTYDYPVQGTSPWAICTTCPISKFIVQHEPDGSTITREFGIKYNDNEGQLLSLSISDVASNLVKSTINQYVSNSEVTLHPFPDHMGSDLNSRADKFSSEAVRPLKVSRIEQDGATFTGETTGYDVYSHALCQKKYSSLGFSKFEKTTYAPNTGHWVIDLVDTVVVGSDCSGAGAIAVDYSYDGYGSLSGFSQFGAQVQSYTSNADGTLATVSDGLNHITSVGNWFRGVPRSIGLPTGVGMSATVGDFGQILSATDENGYLTCYDYDAEFRLAAVTYPSETQAAVCNTLAWTKRIRSTTQVGSDEYGIGANHWRVLDYTGNGRVTTYFDGEWRPLLVVTEDTANAATRSFVVMRYDTMGRQAFRSYPVATLSTINDNLKGVRTTYDVLGRVVQVQQDSETVGTQSVLNTTNEYLPGFQTRVTNPRGFQAVTTYQAFDRPTTDAPMSISLPEGAWTTFTRDSFGKPKSISRSGSYAGNVLGLTRYYVYDAYERLCQTINPESGTTIVNYDAAGNLLWSAEGQTATGLTAASCAADRTATATAAMTSRVYDPLNRVTAVNTPGGIADVDTTYFADGAVNTLTAANPGGNNVTTSYTYNRRRLLTREQLQVNALLPWGFDYAYNANGHLSSQTYPGALVVGYAPDALGRPTQAGTFARNVTYYPNGAISGFIYGNDIVHTMTQNDRRLPARSLDTFGATKVLDDTYTYDANGNVLSMADAAGTGLNDRTWGVVPNAPTLYDGLDRLLSVRGTNWGTLTGNYNALYSYDPLDNIRSAKIGASGYTHDYDLGTPSNTNRLVSMQLNGDTTYAFTTDAAGNITTDLRRGQAYGFDSAHRLSWVGKESYLYDGNGRRAQTLHSTGTIEYFGYGADGRLLADWSNRRQVRNQYIYLGNTLVGLNEVNITTFAVAPRYKHTDALGSPVATTDSARNITNRTVYTPYGIPMTPVDGVGYTGHFEDLGTGLTYMQQRYYDPTIGRFLSVDAAVVDTTTGANFNRYNYANNNPYVFTDPDGRNPESGSYARFSEYVQQSGAAGEKLEAYRTILRADPKGMKMERQNGVNRAWAAERELVKLQGTGTVEWTRAQAQELIKTGRVSEYLGHHINSVKSAPELAGVGDNIEFKDNLRAHMAAHGGNTRNPTTGPLKTRSAMLGQARYNHVMRTGTRIIIRAQKINK